METTEKKIAAKKRVLQEARVICDTPSHIGRYCRTEEFRVMEIERWCSDFNDFMRDHRSQDAVTLTVERVYEDTCSACMAPWETMPADEHGPEACAHCGTETGK